MPLDLISKLVSDKDPTPNKFTIAMGELIKVARNQAGLSQKELAELIYRKQTTVSDIENGKIEVNSGALALIAAALEKPITYFFPPFVYRELKQERFSPLEHELIMEFRKIWDEYLQRVAVDQVRVLGEFDPKKMIWELIELTAAAKEHEEKVKKYFENRGKRKPDQ